MSQRNDSPAEANECALPSARSVPILENWRLRNGYLIGIVSGHPRHEDGEEIKTSSILAFEGNRIRTLNREYELGAPNRDWLNLLRLMRVNPEMAIHTAIVQNSLVVRLRIAR